MNHELGAIFDMDGVLVDSYRAHHESWNLMLAPRGRSMSEAVFAATFGRTSREIIATLFSEEGLSEDEIAALDFCKEAAFRELLGRDFPAMPGAVKLLDSLDGSGFVLAIGSSAPPENVDLVLERLGRRESFGAVVHAVDVTRGKPHPQVFLLAAGRIGIPPRRCVVLEDAPLGIAAAKAAGMASIGVVSTGRTREGLAQADLIVDSLGELSPEILRHLIGQRSGPITTGREGE